MNRMYSINQHFNIYYIINNCFYLIIFRNLFSEGAGPRLHHRHLDAPLGVQWACQVQPIPWWTNSTNVKSTWSQEEITISCKCGWTNSPQELRKLTSLAVWLFPPFSLFLTCLTGATIYCKRQQVTICKERPKVKRSPPPIRQASRPLARPMKPSRAPVISLNLLNCSWSTTYVFSYTIYYC